MNAATGASFKSREEERRACRGLQAERLADILAIGRRVFGSGKFKDEDVVRLNQLFLDTRRRNENMVAATDRGLLIGLVSTAQLSETARLTPPPVPVTQPQL